MLKKQLSSNGCDSPLRVAVDLMGSDGAPHNLFSAVQQMALLRGNDTFVVVVTKSAKESLNLEYLPANIEFYLAEEEITHSEDPLLAIRKKKKSSLVLGVSLVKDHLVDALITTGNSGALIASSVIQLPLLKGVERPALLAVLPRQEGDFVLIDAGGSLFSTAEQLIQYTIMGSAYYRCRHHIEMPTVGLLNIGSESRKGTSEIRRAYTLLEEHSSSSYKFVGNVEGRDAFRGGVDVLVTDGFSGNVFLKSAEGISQFIFSHLREAMSQVKDTDFNRILTETEKQFSYHEHPGAIICGVDGVVVKCHGEGSTSSMIKAIEGTLALLEEDMLGLIKQHL